MPVDLLSKLRVDVDSDAVETYANYGATATSHQYQNHWSSSCSNVNRWKYRWWNKKKVKNKKGSKNSDDEHDIDDNNEYLIKNPIPQESSFI